MGYSMVFGTCYCCKRFFGFNAVWVPSIRINGEREPICRKCVEKVNPMRKKNGVPEIEIHPLAYEPQEEN